MRLQGKPENDRFNRAPALLLAFLLCAFSTQLGAATLYKWVDENGKVRYSDRLPADQSGLQHQQLNSQGLVTSTKEAAKSGEELEKEKEEKRRLEAEKVEKARSQAQDQVLLLTFTSEEEIEHARQNRIQVIDSVIGLIESSITTTQEKLDELTLAADTNYVSKGKEVPGGLAQKIEHFGRKIEIRNEQLAAKIKERDKISRKYDEDLARFRDLKANSQTSSSN